MRSNNGYLGILYPNGNAANNAGARGQAAVATVGSSGAPSAQVADTSGANASPTVQGVASRRISGDPDPAGAIGINQAMVGGVAATQPAQQEAEEDLPSGESSESDGL